MSNFVWVENDKTMKWLKILGYNIDTTKEYEFNFGIKFYEFYIGKKREDIKYV